MSALPQEVVNAQPGVWDNEEFDAAELPNGDLLCIFRDELQGRETRGRAQTTLTKQGCGWVAGSPLLRNVLPHSGQPELLRTQEGLILHIATTGISWTVDGSSWHPLMLVADDDEDEDGNGDSDDGMTSVPMQTGSAMAASATPYYPRAIQRQDGEIVVVGHIGGDNAYGSVDQSVIMLSFRLQISARSSSNEETR